MKVQRLRLTFTRGDEARDLSHRETMRALEVAMREAELPLAYSEGKRSTPQISIGAPLPVGVTSSCELADVFLSERTDPARFVAALDKALPPGLDAITAPETGLTARALQAEVRWAEYEVDVPVGGRSVQDARGLISDLLAASTLPWEHRRENKVRRYDLRPLVLALCLESEGEGVIRLAMRLRIDSDRSGRADQVVAALGLDPPLRVHRRRLHVDRTSPAVRAYRRRVGSEA